MILAIRDLESLLGVPGETVYRWIRQRGLPARLLGDQYRADPVDLLDWVLATATPLAGNAWAEADGDGDSLPAALGRGSRVEIPIADPGDWESSLRALLGAVPELEGPARDLVLERLKFSKGAGFQVLAGGWAVPRPTFPLLVSGGESRIRLCVPSPALHRPGERRIEGWVWILTPSMRSHCSLLAQLAMSGFEALLAERGA